jgi:GH25 family lysozyme M1 (1,4-beta-N-acetylmuramidase)
MNDPCVIDLSHHNPTPDWAKLVSIGVVGVIHKATEGTTYKDPTLYERARAAMDSGLLWSTYHFMRPGSMTEQMDWYLEVVDPVQGERVCLDHEDDGVSLDELEAAVNYLLLTRPDLQVTIYSGHLIEEQLGSTRNDYLADNTSLWTAQYTTASAPSWPTGTWPEWSLWQYSQTVTVPGISQKVDGNRWNGDEDALRLWFGPASAIEPAPPEPAPGYETVDIAIVTTPGVSVSVTLNGEGIVVSAS